MQTDTVGRLESEPASIEQVQSQSNKEPDRE